MSIKLQSLAMNTDLPATQKSVLMILADHSNDEGRSIYPSVPTIARKSSYTERTVQRQLKALREMNLIKIVGRRENRQNEYAINIKAIQTIANAAKERWDAEDKAIREANIAWTDEDTEQAGVTESHPRGDRESPQPRHSVTPGVTESHLRGDTESPYPSDNHQTTIRQDNNKDGKFIQDVQEFQEVWEARMGDKVRNPRGFERMVKNLIDAGVTPEIYGQAIIEMTESEYTLKRPEGAINWAINLKNKMDETKVIKSKTKRLKTPDEIRKEYQKSWGVKA